MSLAEEVQKIIEDTTRQVMSTAGEGTIGTTMGTRLEDRVREARANDAALTQAVLRLAQAIDKLNGVEPGPKLNLN